MIERGRIGDCGQRGGASELRSWQLKLR
jgi:hypothetical protein